MLRQSLYGGDLATNLLELAAIDETTLLEQLSITFELDMVASGPLPEASDELKRALPAELASRHGIFPLKFDLGELVVAVSVPLMSSTIEDLAFSLGLELRQRIALEVRVRQALSRDYRLPFAERYVRLSLSMDSGQPLNLSIPPPKASLRRSTPTSPQSGPPPIGESLTGLVPTLVSSRSALLPHLIPGFASAGASKTSRRLGPFTTTMVEQELQTAKSAKEILKVWLDYAAQFFEYTAVFTVQGEIACGLEARGLGSASESLSRIGIPLDFPGVLADARRTARFNLATLSSKGIDATLARDLRRPLGRQVLAVPAMLRGRAVALLYGDHGDADVQLTQVGETIAIIPIIERALGHVLLTRKRSQSVSPGEPAQSQPPISASFADGAQATVRSSLVERAQLEAKSPYSDLARPILGIGSCPASDPASTSSVDAGWTEAPKRQFSVPRIPVIEAGPSSPPAQHVGKSTHPSALPPDISLQQIDTGYEAKSLAIIERLLTGDSEAVAELLAYGDAGASVLVRELPGPVAIPTRAVRPDLGPIRASECGPLLCAMAAFGPTARPYVIARTADADPRVRQWTTRLLGELPGRQSAMAVAQRLMHDRDAEVRRAAFAAGQLLAIDADSSLALRNVLCGAARNETLAVTQRLAALDALSDLREGQAIPSLWRLLQDTNPSIAAAAQQALVVLACRDFGHATDAWSHWWERNRERHRVEWLIDALTDDSPNVRQSATEQLRSISRLYVGYYDDALLEERSRVQERYRTWWETMGRSALTTNHPPAPIP